MKLNNQRGDVGNHKLPISPRCLDAVCVFSEFCLDNRILTLVWNLHLLAIQVIAYVTVKSFVLYQPAHGSTGARTCPWCQRLRLLKRSGHDNAYLGSKLSKLLGHFSSSSSSLFLLLKMPGPGSSLCSSYNFNLNIYCWTKLFRLFDSSWVCESQLLE